MLNVTSPSPLYGDIDSNNVSVENKNRKNSSMYGLNEPSARPTLKNNVFNISNDNISIEDMKKSTFEFKVILLGSIAVGKTAILSRYLSNEFDLNYQCTIKITSKSKIININNMVQAKLNIWDTCGDEKYRAITRQYYRETNGIILVYDLTSRESFESVASWADEIRNNAPDDSVIILVGNKNDLNKERVVNYQEGKNKADELGMFFIEASAKTGDNIHLLFEKISEAMMESSKKKRNLSETKNIKSLIPSNEQKKDSTKTKCC